MDYEELIGVFTSIIYEALPFIVIGVILAGVLEEFVPQQFMARIIPRRRPLAIALGGVLGLVFPMCECGIIVVMRRLLRKGLPLSVCVSYMLAGPVINVVVMLSTYVAFNPRDPKFYLFGGPQNVVLLRCGLAFVVAFVTALLVERLHRHYGDRLLHPMVVRGLRKQEADNDEEARPRGWLTRLNAISETALHDFVDIMAFLILGAGLAGLSGALLAQGSLDPLQLTLFLIETFSLAVVARHTSIPVPSGSRPSRIATSGTSSRISGTASATVPDSPTTSRSPSASSTARIPRRTTVWSSSR